MQAVVGQPNRTGLQWLVPFDLLSMAGALRPVSPRTFGGVRNSEALDLYDSNS